MGTRHGQLIVLSGPSGSGKTTIGDRLERDYGCEYVVTATTRPPRTGERSGTDYQFLTRPEFERRLAAGSSSSTRSSTATSTARRAARSRRRSPAAPPSSSRSTPRGPTTFGKLGLRTRSVFIRVSDEGTLERRLRARQTDSEEEVRSGSPARAGNRRGETLRLRRRQRGSRWRRPRGGAKVGITAGAAMIPRR